jgi:hypothetical protein
MSKARLIVTAVITEKRRVSEVARRPQGGAMALDMSASNAPAGDVMASRVTSG